MCDITLPQFIVYSEDYQWYDLPIDNIVDALIIQPKRSKLIVIVLSTTALYNICEGRIVDAISLPTKLTLDPTKPRAHLRETTIPRKLSSTLGS